MGGARCLDTPTHTTAARACRHAPCAYHFSPSHAPQGEMKSLVPPKSRFKGRMINYAYTEAKRIRRHLLSTCSYHDSKEDGLEFLVAVKCFGYPGGVISVWVYYALLDKPDDDD